MTPPCPRSAPSDFILYLHRPEASDGSVIIRLHGTGGDETDLVPLALGAARGDTLHGLRGLSTHEGMNRWFRRLDAVTNDLDHIRQEAAALADRGTGGPRHS